MLFACPLPKRLGVGAKCQAERLYEIIPVTFGVQGKSAGPSHSPVCPSCALSQFDGLLPPAFVLVLLQEC